jgi:hypothetical protein
MSSQDWKDSNADKLRLYRREWYHRNKEKEIERIVARKKEMRTWLNEYKSNLACKACGENHIGCLEFHHKNSEDKDVAIAIAMQRGYSKKRIMEEMAKCEVLCANCHRKLHWENGKKGQIEY